MEEAELVLVEDLWNMSFLRKDGRGGLGGWTTTAELLAADLYDLPDFEVGVFFKLVDGVFEVVLVIAPISFQTCWLRAEGVGSEFFTRGSAVCLGIPNSFLRRDFIVVDLRFPNVWGSGRAPDIVRSVSSGEGRERVGWKKSVENR